MTRTLNWLSYQDGDNANDDADPEYHQTEYQEDKDANDNANCNDKDANDDADCNDKDAKYEANCNDEDANNDDADQDEVKSRGSPIDQQTPCFCYIYPTHKIIHYLTIFFSSSHTFSFFFFWYYPCILSYLLICTNMCQKKMELDIELRLSNPRLFKYKSKSHCVLLWGGRSPPRGKWSQWVINIFVLQVS